MVPVSSFCGWGIPSEQAFHAPIQDLNLLKLQKSIGL
jgi:hypothetical protein